MTGRHHRPPLPRNSARAAIVTSLLTAGITLTIALPGSAHTPATATTAATTATRIANPPAWFWGTLSTYTPAARLSPATSGVPPIILAAERAAVRSGRPVTVFIDAAAMPAVVLAAYHHAESVLAQTDPSCHLPWQLLASIGRVESDNGRDVAPTGGITADGTISPPIYGPALDGTGGNAAIPNKYPELDGNGLWERAVGPLQFLPSTWLLDGADGNSDGRRDPNNVYDAALAAARYLCAAGGDLSNPGQLAAAIYSYNHSDVYVRDVVALVAAYEHRPVSDLVTPTARAPKPGAMKHRATHTESPAPAASTVTSRSAPRSAVPSPSSASPTPLPSPSIEPVTPVSTATPSAEPTP